MKMRMKAVAIPILAAVLLAAPLSAPAADKTMVVGSKEFTEQRILGNIMMVLLEANGFRTTDRTGLGGTLVARRALENKQIDVYMEYTGTALLTFLEYKEPITDPEECYETVKKDDLEKNGLVWLPYMSFNNTYCLLMRREQAEEMGISTLSELAAHIEENPGTIDFALNAEFHARPDGYRPLEKAYGFQFGRRNIKKMNSGLIYRALRDGQVQVGLGFATDGRIRGFDLVVLEDDRNYFPVYNPAPVVHKETAEKYPELVELFEKLGEKLDTETMTELNYRVDIEHGNVREAAAEFLKDAGLI